MQRRAHALSSYSSAGSDLSETSGTSPDDCDPPSTAVSSLHFRRTASIESVSRSGYESPDEDVADWREEQRLASGMENVDVVGSLSMERSNSAVASRASRQHASRPSTITEEEPPQPAPSSTSLLLSRHRSLPLPPPAASAHAALNAAAAMPAAPPGLGRAANSWTPGVPPPAPYVHITPLLPEQQQQERQAEAAAAAAARLIGEGSLERTVLIDHALSPLGSPGASRLVFGGIPSALAAPRTGGLGLGGGYDADDDPDGEALLHAPAPTRAPSLIRQKGEYLEHTSRSLSVPMGARDRARFQRQLQEEVAQRQAERSAAVEGRVLPPPPPQHVIIQPQQGNRAPHHHADSDDLPPM